MELSILSGNDFTTQYMRRVKERLGLPGRNIKHLAEWVLKHRRVENHPDIAKEMVDALFAFCVL